MKDSLIAFFVLFLSLIGQKSFSREVNLPFHLKLDIPESMCQDSTSRYLLHAYDSTLSVIISTVETSDFHSGEVFRTLENYSFNLKQMNLQCYKKETDKFYEWNKDYEKIFYKGKDLYLLSYTFYTVDRPYSILFSYTEEKTLAKANDIIQSISYNGNIWKQICIIYYRAIPFWLLYFLLLFPIICLSSVLFFSGWKKEEIHFKWPYVFSVLCAIPILLYTLWGDWLGFICYLIITILAFFPCLFIGMVGAESILKKNDKSKNKNDYNSDFDSGTGATEYAEIIDF